MNKKILGFSLVSNILIGSVSGVVSAENWREKLKKSAEKDLDYGILLSKPLERFNFDKELVVTNEMKEAVNKAIDAMGKCKKSYLDLKWYENRSKNLVQKESEKEKLLEEINKKEKEANELIEKAEQLFKDAGLLTSVVFPWDDIEEKYSFLFKKEKDADFDDINKKNILKKLTFITEDEEKSRFADEYVNKTKEIAEKRRKLHIALDPSALEAVKQDYKSKGKEVTEKDMMGSFKDIIKQYKEELVKAYSKRQNISRKIVEEWISKNKYTKYNGFEYPVLLYRDGDISKDIIVKANNDIMFCNDILKKIFEIAKEVEEKDAYFNQEEPVYIWVKSGQTRDDFFPEKKESWFNKERLEKINKLMILKKVLNFKKSRADKLVSPYKIFLPWHTFNTQECAELFKLENNKLLDTVISEAYMKKKYFKKNKVKKDTGKCQEKTDTEIPEEYVPKIKNGKKLLEAIDFYKNSIASERELMRSEEGKNISLTNKIHLVMLWQARKWLEIKEKKHEPLCSTESFINWLVDLISEK